MSLRARDHQAILSTIDDLDAAEDQASFMDLTVRLVNDLVRADSISFAESDPRQRVEFAGATWPRPDWSDETEAIFWIYSHQHPLCDAIAHDGRPHVRRMSDVIGTRDLHRLELYQEGFAPAGVEHDMMVQLPWVVGLCRCIEMFRGTKDFSERDVEVMTLLQPHLSRAYRALHDRERLTRALDALEGAVASSGVAIAIVAQDGAILESTALARSLLSSYFDVHGDRLPGELDRWVRAQRTFPHRDADELPPPAFLVERGGRRLRVRMLRSGSCDQLLLDERGTEGVADPSAHLTTREVEVLRLIARGLTNREAAHRLDVTSNTVRKHLENAYAKLGVGTRTAAVARAFGGDGIAPPGF